MAALKPSRPESEPCVSRRHLLTSDDGSLTFTQATVTGVAGPALFYWGRRTQVERHNEWAAVKRVRGLISLPKKVFNSFCTWMLLPTVRYTPSCVTPGKTRGGGKKEIWKKGRVIWTNTEEWKFTTCFSSGGCSSQNEATDVLSWLCMFHLTIYFAPGKRAMLRSGIVLRGLGRSDFFPFFVRWIGLLLL